MVYAFLGIALLFLVFGPQAWVRFVMWRHSREIVGMPGTGGEFANHLITQLELDGVTVEKTEKWKDHYDSNDYTVRLGPENFARKSLTALAVAAHEVGHAIQHREGDPRLRRLHIIRPLMRRVERAGILLLFGAPLIGALTRMPAPIVLLAVGGFCALFARVMLHTATLPVEIDASFRRALPLIVAGRYVTPAEEQAVRQVLRAAAFTYIASALADLLSIWRWLLILRRG